MAPYAQSAARKPAARCDYATPVTPRLSLPPKPLSAWSRCRAKRWFDLGIAIAALLIAAPACLLIAIAVRMSSTGPVFFLQKRMGRHGAPFWIVKFRTMVHAAPAGKGCITTTDNEQITRVGRVLRALKLDELPQLINVLRGEMSLVGPRPRVPEQPTGRLDCRPGITGAASLVFAREEALLAGIPRHLLDTYYARRVIPMKQRLDDGYMARATLASDLRLLLLTVFRVWIAQAPEMSTQLQGGLGAPLPKEGCD